MMLVKTTVLRLVTITFVGASLAQAAAAAPAMKMSATDHKMMSSCMAMSDSAMMKDKGCMAMMKKMKTSNADMMSMKKCNSMSHDMMMNDSNCMKMSKMHPDMMMGSGMMKGDGTMTSDSMMKK